MSVTGLSSSKWDWITPAPSANQFGFSLVQMLFVFQMEHFTAVIDFCSFLSLVEYVLRNL